MDTLVHADIFFFVSTVALIVIGVALVVALVYIIKIVRDVSHISGRVKTESDEILDDVKALRGSIRNEGFKWKLMSSFFGKIFKRRTSRKKSSSEDH